MKVCACVYALTLLIKPVPCRQKFSVAAARTIATARTLSLAIVYAQAVRVCACVCVLTKTRIMVDVQTLLIVTLPHRPVPRHQKVRVYRAAVKRRQNAERSLVKTLTKVFVIEIAHITLIRALFAISAHIVSSTRVKSGHMHRSFA